MRRLTTAAYTLFLVTFGVGVTSASASEDGWRSDLPWVDLQSKLSSSATLIDTGYEDFSSECFPEFINFEGPPVGTERSMHALINQPSGLCLPVLSCGYEQCNPRPSVDGHANLTFDQFSQDKIAMVMEALIPVPYFDPANPDSYFNDPSNPSLDIPTKVLFPVVASDVVAAIQFAKKHGLELSVKNSGHSYQGASSKKDTLHINMNRYTRYASTGITDCDAESLGSIISDDLSDQPCHLTVAKNKPAVIRVGGGENWDKTYRAVINANEVKEQEGGEKYHIVGGGSGSVSPMGWTFQGGLSGTAGGSKFGLGADQVIQIEMVLPNGFHVKFGPTEWEDASAEGFIVPRTVGVTGLCRSNPDEQDEDKWIWEDCPGDFNVDFMDLWYAVRGGGGGTWGVVLSMHLQLHEYLPSVQYTASGSEKCLASVFTGDPPMVPDANPLFVGMLPDPLYAEFVATYLITPSILNVTEEHSRSCGTAGGGPVTLNCYGEDDVNQAWLTFLKMKNVTGGEECIQGSDRGTLPSPDPPGSRIEGKIPDMPPPGIINLPATGILIPRSWIEKVGVQRAIDVFSPIFPLHYAALGSAAITSDQANSVSKAHRNAGTMTNVFFGVSGFELDDAFWSNVAPEMFDIDDEMSFPPIFGSNHAEVGITGPRKDDWTKGCPDDWTLEERSIGCVSFQEAIYGTETLKRLEAIKKVVDPNYMFDCFNCVGNNRAKEGGNGAGTSNLGSVAVANQDEAESSSSYHKKTSLVIGMITALLWFIQW